MSFSTLANAPTLTLLHAGAATMALTLGAAILLLEKGSPRHRVLGQIWAAIMLVVALSSFWIMEVFPGSFSPIHILSVVSLVSLAGGVLTRRQGRISAHRRYMTGALIGLVVAGAFTLAPGRLIGKALIGW